MEQLWRSIKRLTNDRCWPRPAFRGSWIWASPLVGAAAENRTRWFHSRGKTAAGRGAGGLERGQAEGRQQHEKANARSDLRYDPRGDFRFCVRFPDHGDLLRLGSDAIIHSRHSTTVAPRRVGDFAVFTAVYTRFIAGLQSF